jgi:CRP-like cAMP-binding protein
MVPAETLKRYSLFAGMTNGECNLLSGWTSEVSLPPGSALFREGGSADALYVLLSGRVALFHNVHSEDAATLRTAEAMNRLMETGDNVPLLDGGSDVFEEYPVGHADPDEIVGISALVPPHRLTATARAQTTARLLRIDAVALRQACTTDPRLANSLLEAAAKTAMRRLQATRQALVALR